MNPKLLALLIAIAFALAGCLGGDDVDPETDENADDASDTQDPGDADQQTNGDNGNGDGTGDEVEPPTAQLSASVSSGDVPLNVSFTLGGSHPDVDALTWSFDLGDGSSVLEGDELPATVDHTYDDVGTFTAVLKVFIGELSDEATLEVTVKEVEEPVVQANPSQSGENTLCLDYLVLWLLNDEPISAGGVHSPVGDTEKVDVDAGTGYTIQTDGNATFIDFYSGEGQYISSGGDSGTVPADASYAYVCVILDLTGGGWPDVPDPQGTFTYQDGF